MDRIENAVFPGRFQPMTKTHVDVVHHLIEKYCPDNLVVAIPIPKRINNFNPFGAEQVEKIARLSLDQAGMEGVMTRMVDMSSGLATTWVKYLKSNNVGVVFTGNEKMAKLVNMLSAGLELHSRAICFGDGSVGNIRASDVRRELYRQNSRWKDLVMVDAADYIDSLGIEFNILPTVRKKRMWSFGRV